MNTISRVIVAFQDERSDTLIGIFYINTAICTPNWIDHMFVWEAPQKRAFYAADRPLSKHVEKIMLNVRQTLFVLFCKPHCMRRFFAALSSIPFCMPTTMMQWILSICCGRTLLTVCEKKCVRRINRENCVIWYFALTPLVCTSLELERGFLRFCSDAFCSFESPADV